MIRSFEPEPEPEPEPEYAGVPIVPLDPEWADEESGGRSSGSGSGSGLRPGLGLDREA